MDDLLCLEIPSFQPRYKKWKKYGYKDKQERQNLKDLLECTTDGFCMYCYSRVKTDGKSNAHLEHAIEKNNSEKLMECIPNIGLACPTCNLSFKKIGEKNRQVSIVSKQKFEESSKCSVGKRKQCTMACKALRNLQKTYSGMDGGEVLLQPMNVLRSNGDVFQLQYNVLKMEFEPKEDENNKLTAQERRFVKAHINRFHLNDPVYRTTQLRNFVQLVIDTNGKIPTYEYNNLIVKLFAKQLEVKSVEERLKICSTIYPILFMVD
jgi:5-methylcytosine-specific restriction endonuclease McrA